MRSALATLAMLGAAQAAAADLDAGRVAPPGLYAVEPDRTSIAFHLHFLGFLGVNGQFPGATGTLRLEPGRPSQSMLAVSVPVGSVHVASALFASRLRSRAWLDAADFPEMRFRSTAVRLTGPGRAEVEGRLTLRGVTRPLTLEATLHEAAADPTTGRTVLDFAATGHLRRSDFGIAPSAPFVQDDVRLTLDAVFEHEGFERAGTW